jgi:hypothetical protein
MPQHSPELLLHLLVYPGYNRLAEGGLEALAFDFLDVGGFWKKGLLEEDC